MQLKPGTKLQDGKYVIIRTLGQGGFGITYLAEQTTLSRMVAVKEFFMQECCARDEATSRVTVGTGSQRELVDKFRQKFLREAQMISQLDHPNIVKIIDIFEENGTAYYTMEYIVGRSLKERIEESGRLDENTTVQYILEVGDALRYVHGKKILHFDIKPSNIMLRESGTAALIDFGVSKHFDEGGHITSSTPVGISEGYAPLEQYRQEEIGTFTPATDIYALGATLYTLLTGEVPPSAAKVYEDGLPALPNSITKATREAIQCSMSPRRKDRPQRVEDFLLLLQKGRKKITPSCKPCKPKRGNSRANSGEITVVSGREPKGTIELEKSEKEPKKRKPFPWKTVLGALAGLLFALLVIGFCSRNKNTPDIPIEPAEEIVVSEDDSTPAPTPQQEETTGSLRITSTPTGAQIWIDGKDSGKKTSSSTILSELPTGKHKIELKLEGYETKSVEVNVEAGKTAQPVDQKLTAIEKPSKVSVTINGNKTTYTLKDSNVSFTMVYVPGGSFMMGAADDDLDASDNEKPSHSVTVKNFSMGETEVTQELWNAVMGRNPSKFKGDNLPVESVSHNDCLTFLKKLNEMTGCTFRLPKESEWEYAARGGDRKVNTKYSGSNSMSQVGWYEGNSGSQTHPVKQKTPNALGLYDMSGNVWERCQEVYVGNYSATSTVASQANGFVVRGGSWDSFDSSCRVSCRSNASGNAASSSKIGLRIAM